MQEVDGAQQLVQRAMVRLTVPKGKFVLNPQLGSLLHTLGRTAPAQREQLALEYAQEALLEMPEVRVVAARCKQGTQADELLVKFELECTLADGQLARIGRGVEDEFLKGAKMTQDFLQKMQQRYEELTGIPADEASDIWIRLRILAEQLELLYQQLEEEKKQAFAQTATGLALEQHAQQKGLQRRKAVAAQGEVTFSRTAAADEPIVIPQGIF